MNQELDQRTQDADDYYQEIVVEDAASMPDGYLGIVSMFAVGVLMKLLFLISVFAFSLPRTRSILLVALSFAS